MLESWLTKTAVSNATRARTHHSDSAVCVRLAPRTAQTSNLRTFVAVAEARRRPSTEMLKLTAATSSTLRLQKRVREPPQQTNL
mmetsp:Transcript_43096/g.65197  ORF Transcript_43096/g.65197 Transcript_43096/m.65197 type:complete len:84 (+) Transcript_43096:357-608(+)